MKLNSILSTALLGISLVATGAQARPHPSYAKASAGRCHGPRMDFGFGVNVCRPVVYRPVYVAPCCPCRPVMVRPVVYAPYVRPSFGVSFGTGFGFGF